MRCVDNSLLLVKNKDVNHIHKCLNYFDKNIKFTNAPSQMVTNISWISKLIKSD